jgi:hypothetical protein
VITQTHALLYDLIERKSAMALKPRRIGIPIGKLHDVEEVAGKQKIKPKRKAPGQTLNQVYAKANKKRFKGVAK